MGLSKNHENTNGGYLFLSHSHGDIVKVRKIRNQLEAHGFEPLCFYLKCLEEEREIADLIKREIDAREWFLYIDSENARKSSWVTLERAYIESRDTRKIISLNLDDPDSVSRVLDRIAHNLRIFLSHSRGDHLLAQRIYSKLIEKDYLGVFRPEDMLSSKNWGAGISNVLSDAARNGCVLMLMTENTLHSEYLMMEVEYSLHSGGNIFPILVGDAKPHFLLQNIYHYPLPENPSDGELDKLIDAVGRYLHHRITAE